MKITEMELVDIIELLDLAEKVITKEDFNCRIEESRIKYLPIEDSNILMIEKFMPMLSEDKKTLYFDTEDIEFFLEKANGDLEIIEIE
jgi:hypothetical protein